MAVFAFDIEIFPNYFLAAFKHVETGEVVTFEESEEEELDRKALYRFMRDNQTVGFNTIGFDLVITYMAIRGFSTKALKKAADQIIVGGKRHWEIARAAGIEIPDLDHVDLIEVMPGQYSLKMYGGKMHCPKMQDLPIDPSARLTRADMRIIRRYCVNDLDVTIMGWRKFEKEIALRAEMGREYGVELRSKSDAQIAEAVLVKEISKIKGEAPERPSIPPGTVCRYTAPDFIRYRSEVMLDVLDKVERAKFVVEKSGSFKIPPELARLKIKLGHGVYKLGIGGLHSTEKTVSHVAGAGTILRDADVSSYYPAIILNVGLAPKHLGKAFTKVYRTLVQRRLAAKNEATAIKKRISELKKKLEEMDNG